MLKKLHEIRANTFALAVLASLLVFSILLIRTAWLSDDSAITLRTVLNFINGFGPTFNIDERVQAYTHPLWFFIISSISFVTNNVFYTTFFVSIVFSILTLYLLLTKFNKNIYMLLFLSFSIFLSKAYMDYSTSGLENPLTHTLLVLAFLFFIKIYTAKDELSNKLFLYFFFTCSALYLNRPDTMTFIAPAAIYVLFVMKQRFNFSYKNILSILLIASMPVIGWLIFSLVYYGFPFPNTAYAKLGTGIELKERVLQGVMYLLHSLNKDPITIFIISAAFFMGVISGEASIFLVIGIALNTIYIVTVGGDFMDGRFLTGSFIVSLIILAITLKDDKPKIVSIAIFSLLLGYSNVESNITSGSSYDNRKIYKNGIADERGFYHQRYALLNKKFKSIDWRGDTQDFRVGKICGGLGFSSINQGPNMHYIDTCALADPLLARMPAKYNESWRIGHFVRQIPANYGESILANSNLLSDSNLKGYYDDLRIITRGDIFSWERFKLILAMNLNLYEKPDLSNYRFEDIYKD